MKKKYIEKSRVEKDKNGRPIQIFRKRVIERSKKDIDVALGKRKVDKVQL